MIKSVIFDIDNTMYSYDQADKAAMEALLGYCRQVLSLDPVTMKEELFRAQKELIQRLGTNSSAIHNRLIRFQTVLEKTGGLDLTEALKMYHIYWDTFIDAMIPEPGLKEFLSALSANGISMGIGTDMTSYIQFKKLEKLDVLHDISYVVTSEEAGAEKPSSVFFDLCLEKAECEAKECVFIGDSLKKDVEGAKTGGMMGILYCPGRNRKEVGPGYPVITSYWECLKNGNLCLEQFETL